MPPCSEFWGRPMLNTSDCQRAQMAPLGPNRFCLEKCPGRWCMNCQGVNWVLNLKGNIWKLLWLYLFPEILSAKTLQPWKYDAFVVICHGMFLYCLSTSWASKDLNIYLVAFKLATAFHEIMFCHLVESAEFNSRDWIGALCFKQCHELVIN